MKLPSWVWGGLSAAALVFGVRLTSGAPEVKTSPSTYISPSSSASSSPSPAPSLAPRPVSFETTGTLVVDRRDASGTWTATVFLKNEMECRQAAVLSLSLVKPDGQAAGPRLSIGETPPDKDLPSVARTELTERSVTPVVVHIGSATGDDMTASRGYLGIASTVAGPPKTTPPTNVKTACTEAASRDEKNGPAGVTFLEIALLPPRPSSEEGQIIRRPAMWAFWIVLAGAAAGSLWSWNVKWLFARMRSVEWQESWCSDIALGAGLLTLLMGATVLPAQTRHLPHDSFALLAALFGALVTLAPTVYGAMRVAKEVGADATKHTEEQGFAIVFVGASMLTLWGAFGQLLTAKAALRELEAASVLATPAVGILQKVVCGIGAVMLVYSLYSLFRFVVEMSTPETPGGRQTNAARAARVAAAAPGGQQLPNDSAPDWRLL